MAQQKQWPVFILAGILIIAVVIIFGILFLSPGQKITPGGFRPATPPRMEADLAQEIEVLKKVVSQDQSNMEAWIKLGNTYFDAKMPREAIEAYDKVLEQDPQNLDVLTDQGVMFREMGQPDQAVSNFRRVLDFNPKHRVALLNLGVVLRYDLQDLEGAADTFREYLSMEFGIADDQVRQQLKEIEAGLAAHATRDLQGEMEPGTQMPPGMTSGMPPGMTSGMPPGMTSGMPPGMPSGMPPGMPSGMPPGMPPGMLLPEEMPQMVPVQREVVVPPEVAQRWKGVRFLIREKTEEEAVLEYEIPVNGKVVVEGTGLTIQVGELLPDFSMDASAITSRSAEPNMPAVWMEVVEGTEKIFEGWVFSKMPEVHAFTHEKYQIVFQGPVARD